MFIKLLLPIVLAATVLSSPKEASAVTVIFDSFGAPVQPGGLSVAGGSTTFNQGLIFTSQQNGLLQDVQTKWNSLNSATTLTLTLYSYNGSTLGPALDSAQASVSSASYTPTNLSFLGWTSSLIAGQSYGLIASASQGSHGWAYTDVAVANSLGRLFFQPNGPVSTSPLTPIASVSVVPAVVPLPAAGWMLIGSLGFLAMFRRRILPSKTA